MKIYTKTGDDGSTMLFGGGRVSKNHIRIEAYGTVDELNSYIGLIRDADLLEAEKATLKRVQIQLFNVGAILATNPEKKNAKPPEFKATEIEFLESEIDRLNGDLPELKFFILPGGHPTASHCHIARCVCRRAERRVMALHEIKPLNKDVIMYLNRLSDYLFVLARHLVYYLKGEEIKWMPE